jgi:hypothetical protein
MLPKFIKVFPREYKRVLERKPVPAVPASVEEVARG